MKKKKVGITEGSTWRAINLAITLLCLLLFIWFEEVKFAWTSLVFFVLFQFLPVSFDWEINKEVLKE